MALKLADYVVTEAGFGSDLGAEKFFDIKCRVAGLKPVTAVVVATIRALKMHGGVPMADLATNNPAAVEQGIENLEKHLRERAQRRPGADRRDQQVPDRHGRRDRSSIGLLREDGRQVGAFGRLGQGRRGRNRPREDRARSLQAASPHSIRHTRSTSRSRRRWSRSRRQFYGADGADFLPAALTQIKQIESLGFGNLPICIAKTQNSLSDDPKTPGRPRGYKITIREAKVSAGAGFVVVYAGNIMTMPGLPKVPAAAKIGMNADGEIYGLF